MAERRPSADSNVIMVTKLATETQEFCIVGTTPLIVSRVSEKARRELLLPSPRKNQAERAGSLKHAPLEEFRAAPYLSIDPKSATLLVMPSANFKAALKAAALDLPGTSKTQIGRLSSVEGEYVPIWGVPKLLMSIVRSADINRTPDIRTRLIVPRWATVIAIRWVSPNLNATAIANLLSASGITSGIGDWRTQKGAGNYGEFRLASDSSDPEFRSIVEAGGYDVQQQAMAEPDTYDTETQDILHWYQQEVQRRGTGKGSV